MLAMQQQPAQPLEPGLRRLKKGDGKDKLKNRVSMAFKKPFSSKPKSPDPVAPLAHHPPAYSLAPPVALATRPRTAPAPSNDERRHSNGAGRSNKPTQHPSDGLVARRSHISAGVVGSSPPLPPLPRKNSVEPADPRVTALLGADLSSQVNPLLPRNSFGPSFGSSMDGLGIGVEHGISSPPSPARTPQRIPTPPHVEIKPLNVRRRSPSPPRQPPPQLHFSPPPQPQLASPPQHPQGAPPALARPVTAPEGVHILRRKSMLRADGEPSEASRRLSMMRRGPPVFASDTSSPSGSTSSHEKASPPPNKVPEPVARESQPAPVPVVVVAQKEDLDALLTSRDRISLLRGGRSSLSAASGQSSNGLLSAKTSVPRGANRKDATKSYTIGAAPAGFDVSLVAPQKSTFTPLKPLHLPAAHAVRPSPLSMKPQPAPPPPPPARSSERYCLRPTVHASTQTPREWREPAVQARGAVTPQRWTHAASTPPQPYEAFPVPLSAVPPPVPPHDTPPQRHNISPSIYSVASFDPRTGKSPGGGHRRNRSYYAGEGEFDEEAEFAYGDEDEPPLPAEGIAAVQRYAQLPDVSEAPELAHIPSPAINYDVPYLSPFPYDDAGSTYRAFDLLSTPLPHVALQHDAQAAPPQIQREGVASPSMSMVDDRTPTITPVPQPAPTFEAASSRSHAMTGLSLPAHESPRSRSASPVPALSNGHSSADEEEEEDIASSQTSSVRRASSTLSSARRSSAGEPLTPPTSAVSSVFPGRVSGNDAALSGDEADEADPVVTIRKASLVTSQVRKASLVTPPTSRPASVVSAHARASSIGSTSSIGGEKASAPSPRSPGAGAAFYLDLPRQDEEDEVPPVPVLPSPLRRDYADAAFPFPASTAMAPPVPAVSASPVLLASPKPVAPSPRFDTDSPVIEQLATPALHGASPAPTPSLALAVPALDRIRPASAPPEESASLPLRRQSESDTITMAVARARTPGLMSREERAARGRSYFLVQALMGESQPEGMIRDWARGDEDGSDDDVSILGGESSAESEFSEEEEDEEE
ncbi:hypothetical protein JCM10450v2_004318 [Rhodotorula kratochvilovae]